MTVDDKTDRRARQHANTTDDAGDVRDVEPSEGVEIDGATSEIDEPTIAAETRRDDAVAVSMTKPARGIRRFPRWLRRAKLVPAVLAVLLAASAGLAAWSYFALYRPDQQIDPGVAHAAVTAASDGTVAILSYAPDTVDKDFATARSHLTGDFLSYYDQFTQQIVAPAAREKAVHTSARVMAAAVSELHPDSAVVLIFVDQQTTSRDRPDPSMSASSIRVTLTEVDGRWLISKFDPV